MCFDLREWHEGQACHVFFSSITFHHLCNCPKSLSFQRVLDFFFQDPFSIQLLFVGCSNLSLQGRNTIQPISVVWRHSTPSRHKICLDWMQSVL